KQVVNVQWLPGHDFGTVSPSATSGTGTGLTVHITTNVEGVPTIDLVNPGTGYRKGDTLTFNSPDNTADPVMATYAFAPELEQLPGAPWTTDATFRGVNAHATSGAGIGMVVDILVDEDGNPFAQIVDEGTGYHAGDRVTFLAPDSVGDPLVLTVRNGSGSPVVISTRVIAVGGNPLTAASTADSGPVSLTAHNITLGEGTKVLANADGAFKGGNVSLLSTAALEFSFNTHDGVPSAGQFGKALSPWKVHEATATILVTGATVKGNDIQLIADSSTNSFAGYDVFGEGWRSYIAGKNVAEVSNFEHVSLTFANASGEGGATITRDAGDFIVDKFQIGQEIRVVGSQYNDGVTYTVANVTPTLLTLNEGDFLTPETTNGTATVKQLLSSILPTDTPGVVDDVSGTPQQDFDNINSQFRFGDILQGMAQAADRGSGIASVIPIPILLSAFFGVTSKSTATVDVLGDSVIDASGKVDIEAVANSTAQAHTPGLLPSFWVAITFADSRGTARAAIGDGVEITAEGEFKLMALVNNTTDSKAESMSGQIMPEAQLGANAISKSNATAVKIPGPALSGAYGKGRSNSDAHISAGAVVHAGAAEIKAKNDNEFEVFSGSKSVGAGLFSPTVGGKTVGKPRDPNSKANNFGQGLAIAISDFSSTAITRVDGELVTNGSSSVEAESENVTDNTIAESVIRNHHLLESKDTNSNSRLNLAKKGITQKTGPLGISAGLAFATSKNKAEAHIGPTARVTVHGNFTFNSTAEDPFRAAAIGAGLQQSKVAIGGALSIAHDTNESYASVETLLGLNVAGHLDITSDGANPLKLLPIEQYE
ncbi:MAG TPA: hypothetical protein VFE86_03525, partial [Ilumatobacteraceae bacterium]|nr:hypothetical protein [Ilumatobacteraceae bacterium]